MVELSKFHVDYMQKALDDGHEAKVIVADLHLEVGIQKVLLEKTISTMLPKAGSNGEKLHADRVLAAAKSKAEKDLLEAKALVAAAAQAEKDAPKDVK